MHKKSVGDKLRELAADDNNRSMAARLLDVLDDVEFALERGVSRAAVLETLHSHGLHFSLRGFDSTLRRLRLGREAASPRRHSSTQPSLNKPAAAPSSAPHSHVDSAHAESAPSEAVTSHNPADLNNIIGSKPDLSALAKLARKGKNK
jgi:hypothetical protein